MGAGADGTERVAVMRCFFAQLESSRHASGNVSAANWARVAIWSDRSADAPRGQEQNRPELVFQASEQFAIQMVLGVSASFWTVPNPVRGADVHFFLDFRLKEPYI